MKREVCPYCGIDAASGPYAHTKREDCISAIRTMHLNYRLRIGVFIQNRLQEVRNDTGGVTGYRLDLNADQTEKLIQELERV